MTNEMKNPQVLSLQESLVSESQRQIAVEDEYKLRELELHVERQRENLGDSHFNALEVMHDLSLEYQFSQQWEKAYDLQKEIVEIRKRELGDTHPDTLRSMIDLAPIIDEREGGEAFQKFSLDLLATRELVLGHSHPDTLVQTLSRASSSSQSGTKMNGNATKPCRCTNDSKKQAHPHMESTSTKRSKLRAVSLACC
jgi:hypothetical protein